MTTTKEVMDLIFKDVEFDKHLYRKILYINIDLITRKENRNLFGSQLIGCYMVSYTNANKATFYDELFDLDYEEVEEQLKKINTINENFKIARDSINLTCFYIAHRFLSNKALKEENRIAYATEILNYFSYRTLLVITSNFFIYPISEEEAVSLFERLTNRYIIKKVKNWSEYCLYRSQEYLKSKFYDVVLKFNDDNTLPNAINDLFSRTKDTMKNIYREFITLNESNEALRKRKTVVNDLEGQEVLMDKLHASENLVNYLTSTLNDRNTFIRTSHIDVSVDIIKNLSYKNLHECLNIVYEYMLLNPKNYNETIHIMNSILINSLIYLQNNEYYISDQNDVLHIMNILVGNLLYARGTDIEINKIKDQIYAFIKKAYKEVKKEHVSNKLLNNLKNGFFIYVMLRALLQT